MGFIKKLLPIFSLVTMPAQSSRINLPELISKQEVRKIRFISPDGRLTYYQNRKGALLLSSNYAVQKVIKESDRNTKIAMVTGETSSFGLISVFRDYENNINNRQNADIYLNTIGEIDIRKIGAGVSPQFHLGDKWVSFFNDTSNTLFFASTDINQFKFSVKLKAGIDPYFTPQVTMVSDQIILYTDTNEKGITAIVEYNRSKNKSRVLYKSPNQREGIDFCARKNEIFLRNNLRGIKPKHHIYQLKNSEYKGFKSFKLIYEQPRASYSSFECRFDEQLYFIEEDKNQQTEVYELNPVTKEKKALTTLNHITSFSTMGDKLVALFHGKFLLFKGNNTVINDALGTGVSQ